MATKSFTQIAVLGLYTETPLHCGAESATGYVDLPIQRERHTQYPVIPGSTLKGVLKDEMKGNGDDKLQRYFGESNTEKGTTTPGSVSFGDGVIVAFPVRSTDGPFVWVTCPFALERALRALGEPAVAGSPAAGEAWAKANGGQILVEELLLGQRKKDEKDEKDELFAGTGPLAGLLKLIPSSPSFTYTREVFLDRLLVLNDRDFQELVETCTEILTRIKLSIRGTTTKITDKAEVDEIRQELKQMIAKQLGPDADEAAVKARVEAELNDAVQGNMFVEEVVPPETLFLTVLRAPADSGFADEKFPGVIRIGGDETIGRGVTHVTVIKANGTKKEA